MLRCLLEPDSAINPPSGAPVEPPTVAESQPPLIAAEPAQSAEQKTENEPDTEAIPAAKTPLIDKLRDVGGKIIQSGGIIFRKGKGRPRNDGKPGKADEIIESAPEAASSATSARPAAVAPVSGNGFLLRRFIVSLVKGAKSGIRWVARGKAEEAGFDRKFVDGAMARTQTNADTWRDWEESLGLVMAKHNIKTKYDEELALISDTGRLFAPDIALLKLFADEIRRRRIAEERERRRREEVKSGGAS